MIDPARHALTLVGDNSEPRQAPSIRPRSLDDYVGQPQMVESLRIAVQAAELQGRPLPHVLLGGPPGLGKTSMAYVLAEEMSSSLTITTGPNLDKPQQLIDRLRGLEDRDILLIDEIHRMRSKVGEVLYSALEDGTVESQGKLRRTTNIIELAPFTLIGCTTHVGDIDAPLRDRMQLTWTLSHYSLDQVAEVIARSAQIAAMPITHFAITALARCSRGTPRIANSLLFRARDYSLVKGDGIVTEELARASLDSAGIDCLGLTEADRRYLCTIFRSFGGGPVGVDAIASALSERAENLTEQIEPFLQRARLLIRDRSGRVATEKARHHLMELGLL